jgi:hypothetical protein
MLSADVISPQRDKRIFLALGPNLLIGEVVHLALKQDLYTNRVQCYTST